MRLSISILLLGASVILCDAETLSFNDHGSIINGTVTFSNGLFRITGEFDGSAEAIAVAPHRVGIIKFDKVKATEKFGRELQDPPDHGTVYVDLVFWEPQNKELRHVSLETMTSDSVKASGKTFKKAEIREMRVLQ